MKGKIGTRLLSVLLALLLVSVMVVPVVSAGEMEVVTSENSPESPKFAITPDFRGREIKIATPLKESELITIVFPEKWLLKNSKSKDPQLMTLTIEASALKPLKGNYKELAGFLSPREIREGERVALLQMPQKMFALFNKDPAQISVNYPVKFFTFYSNIDEMYNDLKEKQNLSISVQGTDTIDSQAAPESLTSTPSTLLSTFYGEWAQYYRKSAYANSITYVTGKIKPYSSTNDGQTTTIYQEREIYTNRDGDTIELTLYYRDDGKIFLSVPIYDEHELKWETTSTWIDATAKPYFDYYVSIANGLYEIWFQDRSTDQWYYYSYDDSDNPATAVDWLVGSSELYLYGAVQHHFEAITYPLIDEWTRKSDGTWYKPGETFDFIRYTSDQPYVYVNTWFSSNNIYSYHKCADTQS